MARSDGHVGLNQLLTQTHWGDLDYLIVDMPPGTGDIQLTLAQRVPVSGAVIVTTPQDIALADARKGLEMFQKVHVPVLGVVENMSIHVCTNCGHEEHIFGEHGGRELSEQYGVPLLGALPLDKRIRQETDEGKPTVAADPRRPARAARSGKSRCAPRASSRRARRTTAGCSRTSRSRRIDERQVGPLDPAHGRRSTR